MICPADYVRFTPKSGHGWSEFGCPLCAKSGHFAYGDVIVRCLRRIVVRRGFGRVFVWDGAMTIVPRTDYDQKTSLARTRIFSGIVRPRTLAVVVLIIRSSLTGCSTGISAGLAPRKNLVDEITTAAEQVRKVRAVRDQPSRLDVF